MDLHDLPEPDDRAAPGVTYLTNSVAYDTRGGPTVLIAPDGYRIVSTCLPADEAREVTKMAARVDGRQRAEIAAERGAHPRFYVDAEKLKISPDVAEMTRQAVDAAHAYAEEHLRNALQVRTWLVTIEHETDEQRCSPGAVVRGGPVDAVWRVLARTRLGVQGVEGACDCGRPEPLGHHREDCPAGKRVLIPSSGFLMDLEPVHPHEVGPTQRVYQLPAPTREISPALAAEWRSRTAAGEQAIT